MLGVAGLVLGLFGCGVYLVGKSIQEMPEKMEQERRIAALKPQAPVNLEKEIREQYYDDWNEGRRDKFPQQYMPGFESNTDLVCRYIELMVERELAKRGYSDFFVEYQQNRFRAEYKEWERRNK